MNISENLSRARQAANQLNYVKAFEEIILAIERVHLAAVGGLTPPREDDDEVPGAEGDVPQAQQKERLRNIINTVIMDFEKQRHEPGHSPGPMTSHERLALADLIIEACEK